MTLTVGYDATAAARQSAGIGRYARELLQALVRRGDEIRYSAFYCNVGQLAGSLPAPGSALRVRSLPLSDRLTNALWHRARIPLPIQMVLGRFDIFHSPDFTLPPTAGRPTAVTIHDLAFMRVPECAFPSLREYLEVAVPRSARRADRIIAVSEATRRDVVELLGIAPERVVTIHEGVSPAFAPQDRRAAWGAVRVAGVGSPYILSVGTLEPRKNYVRLLQAYAIMRSRGAEHRLVIAGKRGWLYEPIFETVRSLRLEPHVTFLQPSDDLLPSLYSAADAFVYPSLYEGFGIPPLEALACGTPVACSNSSSLPEVVGDEAVLFDPSEPEAIAGAVQRLLDDGALADRLRRGGPIRARTLTWDRAASRTVELYRELAGNA